MSTITDNSVQSFLGASATLMTLETRKVEFQYLIPASGEVPAMLSTFRLYKKFKK